MSKLKLSYTSKPIIVSIIYRVAAVSCSAGGPVLGGVGLGSGTTGKLGLAWVVHVIGGQVTGVDGVMDFLIQKIVFYLIQITITAEQCTFYYKGVIEEIVGFEV